MPAKHAHRRPRRRPRASLVLLAVCLAAVLLGYPPTAPTTPQNGQAAPSSRLYPLPTAPGTRVVFFGDSWADGEAAQPATAGFAYLTGNSFGWDYRVDAVGGTGYVNPGLRRTYPERMAAAATDPQVQLLILQGSVNDAKVNLNGLRNAVEATLDAALTHYPNAVILVLGPAPATLPVSEALRTIDSTLRSVAGERRLDYISPVTERWISAANYGAVIDTQAGNHPSTQGHSYLARRLEAALRNFEG